VGANIHQGVKHLPSRRCAVGSLLCAVAGRKRWRRVGTMHAAGCST